MANDMGRILSVLLVWAIYRKPLTKLVNITIGKLMYCFMSPMEDSFCKPAQTGKYYPFYPIQTMCEQANHCKEDQNVHRLGELYRSAEYHQAKYEPKQYSFIMEFLQEVLEEIQTEKKKAREMQKMRDY